MFTECCPECGHLLSKSRSVCPFCGWDEDEDLNSNTYKIERELTFLDSSAGRHNHLHGF